MIGLLLVVNWFATPDVWWVQWPFLGWGLARGVAAHCRIGFPPRVRHVRHDQESQAVGPVELARRLDLDVLAQAVETDRLGTQDLGAHEGVARERVEPLRVECLIERELQVDRLVVQRNVAIVGPGKIDDRDLSHPTHPFIDRSQCAIRAGGRFGCRVAAMPRAA